MIDYLPLWLILVSALIHPFWNILLKKSENKVIFYFNIHLFFSILFSFILFVYPVNSLSSAGWFLVISSGIVHFFYQLFLCKSYELGDMSLTYPIIRSAPLFVVIIGIIFLGEKLSLVIIIGILLTVMGAQLINQKKFSIDAFTHSWRYTDKKIISVALLAAVFSAGYSVIDKKGVLRIEPVLFFYLMFALSGFLFGIYLFFSRDRREDYWLVTKRNRYKITLAAILEFSSYVLILYAFRLANVAVVVAIRQISVVFGAVMGVFLLKEKYGGVRILASMIIFAGIYLLVAFK